MLSIVGKLGRRTEDFFMGTLINAVAITIGGALGLLFRERFPERMTQTALHVMGLFTLLVGVRMAIQGEELIMVLISLALGAMLGEWMNIEDRLERFGLWLETRLHLTEQSPAKGFINASLLFCVGSMAIVGSITEGLNGDRSILVTKAIMDGILSIAFAAGMGVGVLGSALPILLYQGSLTLLASKLQAFFTPPMIGGLTSVGGVIVMGIGVNILGLKKVRVGNVIPALVIIILILYFKALM